MTGRSPRARNAPHVRNSQDRTAPENPRGVRRLAASVLAAEALVLVFFVLAASRLNPDDTGAIAGIGLTVAASALGLCGFLRWRRALWVGWALQVALIAAGVIVPVMYVLGMIFAVLWYVALHLGRTVA